MRIPACASLLIEASIPTDEDNREFTRGVRRVGNDLLSHAPTGAVSSAQVGLTAGFGMGPGGPPPRGSPTLLTPLAGLFESCEIQPPRSGAACTLNEALGR